MISVHNLWRRSRALCWYCDQLTWCGAKPNHGLDAVVRELCAHPNSEKVQRRRATREHLRRKADGGSNNRDNIVLACAHCNHGRGTRTPEEHQLHVRARLVGRPIEGITA